MEVEIDDAEIFVSQLDGFLNGLRCVIGHQSRAHGAVLKRNVSGGLDKVIADLISDMECSSQITSRQ